MVSMVLGRHTTAIIFHLRTFLIVVMTWETVSTIQSLAKLLVTTESSSGMNIRTCRPHLLLLTQFPHCVLFTIQMVNSAYKPGIPLCLRPHK